MSGDATFDYTSFVSANSGKRVTGIDYVHAVFTIHRLSPDLLSHIARLFWPEFVVVDGTVFVRDLFDMERHRSLVADGRSLAEVQYWINLLEVTALCEGLSLESASAIAEILADCWNSKLKSDFNSLEVAARAVRDDDLGEVFVTIGGTWGT